ncbi:probable helicase with zinc finger domain isoform X2 [Cylas formicarius]|uniref:probable helicase with zinc finger domain isoform X2 n=1 Tax=Cylas formicarius TaxID=197179 RepID=UPI00295893CF|nr:probable helicase with zinc finger domain isoform X2 [Cylas formicarius]
MDVQAAQEFARQKNWKKAVESYTKFLRNKHNSIDLVISSLYARSECLFELNNYLAVVNDCRSIIQLTINQNDHITFLARKKLVQALFLLQKFVDAEVAVKEWLSLLPQDDTEENKETQLILQGLLQTFDFGVGSKQKFTNLMKLLEARLTATNNNSIFNTKNKMEGRPASLVSCIYCNVSFVDKMDLRTHCQTELHEMMIMSDDGHDWYWRPPPRGFKSDTYVLCANWRETSSCRYGMQCVQAHGEDELMEWKERFRYREMKLQRAREKELFGKSYTEELLEKWVQYPNPNALMCDKIEDVEDCCSCPLSVTVSSKNSLHHWTFLMKTRRPLKAVALLQDTHRNHFFISTILVKNCKVDLKNDQEWISQLAHHESYMPVEYRIKVMFTTGIFGTFRQSIVFDFSFEPVLVKHLCVDVVPDSEIDKINEIRKEITLSISERWTATNSDIVHFRSSLVSSGNDEWETRLKGMYPCPQAETFVLSHATLAEKKFTRNNYRERMHQLLFIEEMARYDLIAQYNLTTKLQIAHSYILSPNSMAASTAKYSTNGELFASIDLGKELSEDTSEGRLILMHCNTVYLCPTQLDASQRIKIYEALIEDKGKNTIYLRLSSDTVQGLQLTPDSDLEVQIQFQLNRIPYCEWHYTLDKMVNFKTIFPDTYLEPVIPWSPSRQWSRTLDSRLNIKQKEAVNAITTPLCVQLPPILVIGPFGTGKTFTLAQAIRNLIKDSSNRILLCTHSNSAADLYIKDYLDKWVDEGEEHAKPLRIYYQKRWVATVNPVVQKYCLISMSNGTRKFNIPTIEDLIKHRIVVVTLSTSVYLSVMGLPQGFFTHILLDEAAQAIECETVTPLALASENTRLVLAGDHMQLGPDIFSPFAKERDLHISLLERLYDHYPQQFSCKILLCENYRAHESIIQFTSESFYDQKLVSSSKQPKHFRFYPLTFFTTRGEDVQDKNSTAFYNNSEVYEVVERVAELKRTWPDEWGKYTDQSIGVVTPYADQVFRIRSELRKRRIENVCVERVLNVQGKQFRAIILSTVRTRKTCSNDSSADVIDYGFLSNSKLLNTAITRAQSLVAVVGDPIALCSLGRCSKVWERFIQICKDNESLFGITWTQLKLQLDGIELKKIYTLNPLAPEFVPRKYKENVVQAMIPPAPAPVMTHPVVPPPGVSPFGIQDCRFLAPLIYPPQPRPFVFNLGPGVAGLVSHPIANGFSQPIRVVNPPQPPPPPPMIVASRISNLQPIQIAKTVQQHVAIGGKPNGTSHNKLIQFMNNVHFPEASVLNDCVNLLPQNMSLADMLLQPPSLQERWYNYLKEGTGEEAAEKFRYLLHTTNQKGSKVQDRLIFDCATPQSCDSPTFNWYDSPTNQININKPVYIQNETSNGHNKAERFSVATENGNASSVPETNGEDHLQQQINEVFANLSIGSNSDMNDVYKAFADKDGPDGGAIRSPSVGVPRFYKYFQ